MMHKLIHRPGPGGVCNPLRRLLLLAAGAILALGACAGEGTDDEPGPNAKLVRITLSPLDAKLTVKSAGGETLQFTARGTYDDGKSKQLSEATWELAESTLGSLDTRGLFTAAGLGGKSTVTVSSGSVTTTGSVTVTLSETVLDSGVGSELAQHVSGTPTVDKSRGPLLVYPEAGTLVPYNLSPMLLQWKSGASGNLLFGVRIKSQAVDVLAVTTQQKWQFSSALWSAILQSCKGSSLSLSVAGTGLSGGALYGSAAQELKVGTVPISGTIYYWATGAFSATKNGIMQIDTGSTTAKDYYTQATSSSKRCSGCHALSRDGKKIVFVEYNDPVSDWTNYIKGLDVGSKKAFLPTDQLVGDFFSFSPTADRLVSSEAGVMTLRQVTSGTALGTLAVPSGQAASHPDWSPAADRLALALFPDTYTDDYHFCQGSLALADVTATGFGSPKVLLASSGQNDNNYYPTFSPDGVYLAYNNAAARNNDQLGESACDLYANPGASLRMVAVAGGKPVSLTRANGTGDVTNSWPKWAPAAKSDAFWYLAFSSTRDYGAVVVNSTKKEIKGAKLPQIWITGVEMSRLGTGQDPSYPAFWMPGQQTDSGNHIPFWTRSLK